MSDLFEVASRKALRFNSPKGKLSVEDLWQLPLTSAVQKANLDDLAKGISAKINASEVTSFVNKNTVDKVLALQLEILKRVISVKIEEKALKEQAAINASKKKKLLSILSTKQDDNLHKMSEAQIVQMINEL
jgi:hypothetical protein